MSQAKFRTVYILSIIIGILMIVQSAGGLLIQGLYRDNVWGKTAWDLIVLWIVLGAACLISSALLLWNIKFTESKELPCKREINL